MSVSADAAPTYPPKSYRILVLVTLLLALIPTIMASTMVNVATTDVMGAFGVGQETAHWLSTGFLSATTVAMLMNGWFVTNLGPRRTFLLAIGLFAVGSFWTQQAGTFDSLIIGRCVQGAAAGLLQPLTVTVIFPIFPLEERGKAMGMFSMGMVMAPAFGPVLGGLIVDELGWRYLFTPMLPLSFVAAAMALHWLPESVPSTQKRPFNWTSFVLVTISVVGFLYATSNGVRLGWASAEVLLTLLIAAIAMVIFVAWELVTRAPLLEVRLFLNRSFAVSSIVAFTFGAGMFASIYLLPLFVRTVQGFDGTSAGLLLLPSGLIMIIVFPLSGLLAQAWPPRRTVTLGLLMFGTSSLMYFDADVDTAFWFLALVALFGRIGLGLTIPSLQFHGVRGLPTRLLPYGAGTFNFIRSLGGAIGVNLIAVYTALRLEHHRDYFAATQTPDNTVTQELLRRFQEFISEGGWVGLDVLSTTFGYLMRTLVAQATTQSFRDGFIITGVVFILTILPALMLSGKSVQDDIRG